MLVSPVSPELVLPSAVASVVVLPLLPSSELSLALAVTVAPVLLDSLLVLVSIDVDTLVLALIPVVIVSPVLLSVALALALAVPVSPSSPQLASPSNAITPSTWGSGPRA